MASRQLLNLIFLLLQLHNSDTQQGEAQIPTDASPWEFVIDLFYLLILFIYRPLTHHTSHEQYNNNYKRKHRL